MLSIKPIYNDKYDYRYFTCRVFDYETGKIVHRDFPVGKFDEALSYYAYLKKKYGTCQLLEVMERERIVENDS